MKAYLRSARIAPKKANIIAKMVRGMNVGDAIDALAHTHKKGARMIEDLIKSAVANAEHNDKQDASKLMVKTIVVNQSLGYPRGVPMARGRMRPMRKFLSHIDVTLGVVGGEEKVEKKIQKKEKNQTNQKKEAKAPSQKAAAKVQKSPSESSLSAEASAKADDSSTSSQSS